MRARATLSWRGAALVELALVTPVLLGMVAFSLRFVELVRAQLKLQEATRFMSWEMTAHVLQDFGGPRPERHEEAFERARQAVLQETKNRFVALDSVERGGTRPERLSFSLSQREVPDLDAPLTLALTGSVNPLDADIVGAARGKVSRVQTTWGFERRGLVKAEGEAQLRSALLPGPWGDRGRRVREHHSLVASSWNLTDGTDARMKVEDDRDGPRAGTHRDGSDHALYRQVKRMTFLGLDRERALVSRLKPAAAALSLPLPLELGTYVVSLNYGLGAARDSGCRNDPSHPGRDGMNNLEKVLDSERRSCFDTAPFRSRASYADSPSVQIFRHRGPWFMGCGQAMADDPSGLGPVPNDRHGVPVGCEGS